MTINFTYDKKFAIKSIVVLAILGGYYKVYHYAYNKGVNDMVTYIVNLQNEEHPKLGDDQTGHGSTR